MMAFRKRFATMLGSLELRESCGKGQDLLPFAPTEEELFTIWERFAMRDQLVLEMLLRVLSLVRYPVSAPSPAITVLLKVIFSFPCSHEAVTQALQALKFQFSSELDGFLQCAERHAGLRPETIPKACPSLIRRSLMLYGFVAMHLHDEDKVLSLLGPSFPKVKTTTEGNTTLTALLIHSLQSVHGDIRQKAIEVIGGFCVASENLSSRCLSLFDRAFSKDIEQIRVAALKIICDLCFFYPSLTDRSLSNPFVQENEPSSLPFKLLIADLISAPPKEIQLISTIAVVRLLFHTDVPEPEKMLLSLVDKYFTCYSPSPDDMTIEEHQCLMRIIYMFFEKYSDEKESHQNEIAHTLVLLVVEALEEKIIPSSISTLVQGDQPRLMDEEERVTDPFPLFMRKVKFLLSFLHSAFVPLMIENIRCNVAAVFQAEMSVDEAIAIIGLNN